MQRETMAGAVVQAAPIAGRPGWFIVRGSLDGRPVFDRTTHVDHLVGALAECLTRLGAALVSTAHRAITGQ